MSALFCVLLLCMQFHSLRAESLYYIHTGLTKAVDPAISQFTTVGLLDDREIHFYKQQRNITKLTQTEEKTQEDYWETASESRKSYEFWFKRNFKFLMSCLKQNESDLHVLQWRHGCEVERQGDQLKFSKGVDEYGFDGENFLYFNNYQSRWIASAEAAQMARDYWNNEINIQSTKNYLENKCVDWLRFLREYEQKELRNATPPQVHVFAVKSIRDDTKLKLTCLATGLLHKDMKVEIRKYRMSVPEELTDFLPNHDGTFQMRKSVEIKQEEDADYDCIVTHRSLKEPIIIKWDGKCWNCPPESASVLIGAVFGVIVVFTCIALVLFILKEKMNGYENPPGAAENENSPPPQQGQERAEETPDITTPSEYANQRTYHEPSDPPTF